MARLRLALLIAAAACGPDPAAAPPPPGFPDDSTLALGAATHTMRAFRVDTVARGLNIPWAMAQAPDGRIFVTERGGRIRVLDGGGLREAPWATLDVYAADGAESGLMGIAVAPDFATSGSVYVYGTFRKTTAERERRITSRIARALRRPFAPLRALTLENRVIRLTDSAGVGVAPRVIVDHLPANQLHAGGALAIGPDTLLYLSTGDAQLPKYAGRGDPLTGSILRYHLDGRRAADFSVAFGLRNAQGLAWEPSSGVLFAIEHGPTGLSWENRRTGGDELNEIGNGGNFGWPETTGIGPPEYQEPLRVWPFSLAPGGMTFSEGELFVTGLRGVQLRRLRLERSTGGAFSVVYDEPLLRLDHGRLRAIMAGADGSLYVGTSNRDGRGTPGPNDDLILKLTTAR